MRDSDPQIRPKTAEVWLMRHGETEWSRAGKHTGRTDILLTERGRQQAATLGSYLGGRQFARVLSSPLKRALETAEIAGFVDIAQIRDDLMEWDYGQYEGRTTRDIRTERPGWSLWIDGVPEGETAADVGCRADRVIAEIAGVLGDVAVFAHGHVLRVLAARWLRLPPLEGRSFTLGTATVSVLGYERERPVIVRWNTDYSRIPSPRPKEGLS